MSPATLEKPTKLYLPGRPGFQVASPDEVARFNARAALNGGAVHAGGKPLVAGDSGPVVVLRPLDLRGEVHEYVHDLRRDLARRREFMRSGVMPIVGAAAGAWTFTNGARTSLLNGTFDLDTDTFKVALFLSTSNIGASSTTYAGVTNEHSNANGYTTGGISYGVLALSGTTTVTVDDASDAVWTASGGSITARFAVIYENGGNVLCYCLLDSTPADVTATTGNTLTLALHASGIFTLA